MKDIRGQIAEFVGQIQEEVDNALMNRPDVQKALEGGIVITIEINGDSMKAKMRKDGDSYEEAI